MNRTVSIEGGSPPTCPALLSAARAVARQRKGWTDRACAVLEQGGNRYAVESYEGKIVWAGNAHCPYCARVQAIASKPTQSACARHASDAICAHCNPKSARSCDGAGVNVRSTAPPTDTPKNSSTAAERCARM